MVHNKQSQSPKHMHSNRSLCECINPKVLCWPIFSIGHSGYFEDHLNKGKLILSRRSKSNWFQIQQTKIVLCQR